jgi:hypothetical protein
MTTPIDDGGPAYPCQELDGQGMPRMGMEFGLSMRDVFAMHALQGMLAAPEKMQASYIELAACTGKQVADVIAICAFQYADAMLAARKGAP